MAYSKIYKNWSFTDFFDASWNVNGTLTYASFDNVKGLPVFHQYNNRSNNQPIYPVYVKIVGYRNNMPIYRLYDGTAYTVFHVMIELECSEFRKIWIKPDGSAFIDEVYDHTAEGCFKINYINSDWLFIDDKDKCLKARFTVGDETIIGHIRTKALNSDNQQLYAIKAPTWIYNLGVIAQGYHPTDADNEYVCELVPWDKVSGTIEYCGFSVIDVNKDSIGYTAKVYDYILENAVREIHTINQKYSSTDKTEGYDTIGDYYTWDFGYDYDIRMMSEIGNDSTNILMSNRIGSDPTYYKDNMARGDNYIKNYCSYDKPNSIISCPQAYITGVNPVLSINDKRYTLQGYDPSTEALVMFNLTKFLDAYGEIRGPAFYFMHNQYIGRKVYSNADKYTDCPMPLFLPSAKSVSQKESVYLPGFCNIVKLTKDVTSTNAYTGETTIVAKAGQYKITPYSIYYNELHCFEKADDGIYLNSKLYPSLSLEERKLYLFNCVYGVNFGDYLDVDPVAIGAAKRLKHLIFSFLPINAFPNMAIPEIQKLWKNEWGDWRTIRCAFELDAFDVYDPKVTYPATAAGAADIGHNEANWINGLFGYSTGKPAESVKMHILNVRGGKTPFVAPMDPVDDHYYAANGNGTEKFQVNDPFYSFVNEYYEDAAVQDDSNETAKFVAVNTTRYIVEDSWTERYNTGCMPDKFGSYGLYYSLLVDNLKESTDSKSVDEIIEDTRKSQYWVTPEEYYSKSTEEQLYCCQDGTGYFKYGDNRENRPNWFWVNTLKSWCTFRINSSKAVQLCVWNGRNNWDTMDEILNLNNEEEYKKMAKRYMYNTRDINECPSFTCYPLSNKPTAYRHSRRRKFLGFTVGHTYYQNDEPNKPFVKKSIRLTADSKFSYHDSNTYQTIKPAKIYLDDLMKRYVFPIGCPMLERLPSGEMSLIYHLELYGVKDRPLITNDMIKFMNSICISFFGDGSDKTIDNWKQFRYVDYSQEVPSEEIMTEDDSTLYEKEEINTSVVNNDFASLTFTIPTEYPTTDNAGLVDYAERWEK